jgi:prevent-host-death family protein
MSQGAVVPDENPEPRGGSEEVHGSGGIPGPEDYGLTDADIDEFQWLIEWGRKESARCADCTYADLLEELDNPTLPWTGQAVLLSRQTRQDLREQVMARRQKSPGLPDIQEPRWQLQDAKQRFSELARHAYDDGPQLVTKHGEDYLAVLPIEEYREYRRMKEGTKPDFKALLRSAPDFDVLDIRRPAMPARTVELDSGNPTS